MMKNRLAHGAWAILPGFVLTIAVAFSLMASTADAKRVSDRGTGSHPE